MAVVEVGRDGGIQELFRDVRFTGVCDLLEREIDAEDEKRMEGARLAC